MIDMYTSEKIRKMEVYVSTVTDISDIKTAREAYNLSEQIAESMVKILESNGITVNDTYEVFRTDDDDIANEIDEE